MKNETSLGTESSFPRTHIQWMYESRKSGHWSFFSAIDAATLENAEVERSTSAEKNPSPCYVNQRRYRVHLSERLLIPSYWDEPNLLSTPRKVVRASWVYETNDSKNPFVPMEESEAAALECQWVKAVAVAKEKAIEVDAPCPIVTTKGIAIHDHISLIESRVLKLSVFESVDIDVPNVAKGMNILHRGQMRSVSAVVESDGSTSGAKVNSVLSPRSRELEREDSPAHLAFVIHGIGEYYCANRGKEYDLPDIIESADILRTLSTEIRADRFDKQDGFVEFIPIDWSGAVRDEKCDSLLESVSLHSLQMARNLMNEVLADVLFYMGRQDAVIKYAADKMNKSMRMFMKHNPDFKGSISIMGHSLGSVVAYDLLKCQSTEEPKAPLEFNVKNFFAFGSPIGLFEACRGHRIGKEDPLSTCSRAFNIYHPADPVAYRVEPLLKEELKDYEPVRVATYDGSDHLHYRLRDFGSSLEKNVQNAFGNIGKSISGMIRGMSANNNTALNRETSASVELEEKENYGWNISKGQRLDFELQSTSLEHLNQIGAALFAHTSYWQSKDFISFVLHQIYEEQNSKKALPDLEID